MKTYSKALIAMILAISAFLTAGPAMAGIHIEIGDRGFFTRGQYYNEGGRRYCWVPGHYGRHHQWIHGHYRLCY